MFGEKQSLSWAGTWMTDDSDTRSEAENGNMRASTVPLHQVSATISLDLSGALAYQLYPAFTYR